MPTSFCSSTQEVSEESVATLRRSHRRVFSFCGAGRAGNLATLIYIRVFEIFSQNLTLMRFMSSFMYPQSAFYAFYLTFCVTKMK